MTPVGSVSVLLGSVAIAYSVPIVLTSIGRGPRFMKDLGFIAGAKGNIQGWMLAAVVAAAYASFSLLNLPVVVTYATAISWLKGLALLAACEAGIFEEAFFRRFIMDALARRKHGPFVQVAASGLAFGLAHVAWGLLGGNLQFAIGAAVATTLLGFALGSVYILGHRSLAPCIAAHVIIDAVIEPGLALSSFSGFRGIPQL